MTIFRRICKVIALPLAAVMLLASVPLGAVQAGMVSTEDVIGTAQVEADREAVNAFLASEAVSEQLRALGIDPDEAARRASALSEDELRVIAGRINELPAGQDAGSTVAAIVGVALFIFLVLLITDLLGLTDVFPFVKSQRV